MQRGGGATLGGAGKRTGSKNKRPYPMTDAVLRRIEEQMERNLNKKYLQGIYTPKNPNKYAGNPTNVIYRSSWELKFFNWCDSSKSVVKWSSEEIVVPYICEVTNTPHRYFPDVLVEVMGKSGDSTTYLVEIKPKHQTSPPNPNRKKTKKYLKEVATYGRNVSKWKAAEEYARRRGWAFRIVTEKELGIGRAK